MKLPSSQTRRIAVSLHQSLSLNPKPCLHSYLVGGEGNPTMMIKQQSDTHLRPSLIQWKWKWRSDGTLPSYDSSLGNCCNKGETQAAFGPCSLPLLDCEWNCSYSPWAPKNKLPCRRRFVVRPPSTSSRNVASSESSSLGVAGLDIDTLTSSASASVSVSSSASSLRRPQSDRESRVVSCTGIGTLSRDVIRRVILFAGVEDACTLFVTSKEWASQTDQHGSLILPELLIGGQRLHLIADVTKGLVFSDLHEFRRSGLPANLVQVVGDLVARFMACDPYFDPEHVAKLVFVTLMKTSLFEREYHRINWIRYHLWLPLLQWLQTYTTTTTIVPLPMTALIIADTADTSPTVPICTDDEAADSNKAITFTGGSFPCPTEWSPVFPFNPPSPIVLNMWIHLVHSRLTPLVHVHHMLQILLDDDRPLLESLSRFLDRTKHILEDMDRQRCTHSESVWKRIKFSILLHVVNHRVELEKVVDFFGRFAPHLLFQSSDLDFPWCRAPEWTAICHLLVNDPRLDKVWQGKRF